jgi:hypothetical protein
MNGRFERRAAGADRSALACGVRVLRAPARRQEGRRRAAAGAVAGAAGVTGEADRAGGFIQRWLLLEPIRVPGQLTESAYGRRSRRTFPCRRLRCLTTGTRSRSATVSSRGTQVDTVNYNVNLYHFAYALNKPTTNVLFWAVTVVNAPREMRGVRLAIGSNAASVWWVNGTGSDRALQRSPGGDRRRRLEAADVEPGRERDSRRDRQRGRRDGFLRAVSRRERSADQDADRDADGQ